MKRALLAVPLLGIAGWAGATVYAGNQAQSAYDELLGQLRQQHGLQVEPLAYKKDFLASHVKTVVNGKAGPLSQTKDFPEPFRSLASRFVLDHEIEHGPVLLSNGLQALAGRIKTTLDLDSLDPEFAKAWQQACDCEHPLLLQSEISLQGEYSHVFDMAPIDWRDGSEHLSFAGVHSESGVDSAKLAYSNGQSGKLSLQMENGDSIEVAAGQWQLSGREYIKNIIIGDVVLTIPSVSIQSGGVETKVFRLRADINSDVQAGGLNTLVDVGIGSIATPAVSLDDTHFDIAVTGLPVDALLGFSEQVASMDLSEEGAEVELLTLYRDLLVPGIGVRYGLRGNHPQDGAFDASVELSYAPRAGKTFDDMHTAGDLLRAMKAAVKVDFNEALLARLPPPMAHHPMLQSVFQLDQGDYSLRANIINGRADMNGQAVPVAMMFEQQLAQPLPSIEDISAVMQASR